MDGIGAFDQEIDFDSCINDSGAGCPNISWAWVEMAKIDSFASNTLGAVSSPVFILNLHPTGFRVFQGGTLEIEARASVPTSADHKSRLRMALFHR